MAYRVQVQFLDGRQDVIMPFPDERTAFNMFGAMSKMEGVRRISMGFMPSGQAAPRSFHVESSGGGDGDEQIGTQEEQELPSPQQQQEEMQSSGLPPPPFQSQQQQQPPPQSVPTPPLQQANPNQVLPKWMQDMRNAAASLPKHSAEQEGHGQYQPLQSSNDGQGYQQQQQQQKQQQPPAYQDDGRSPLDVYNDQLQLEMGESGAKRFKRAVETRPPPATFQRPQYQQTQQQQHQQQALPTQQLPIAFYQQQAPQAVQWVQASIPPPAPVLQDAAPVVAFDSLASLGTRRPFNKTDADMLAKATQMLDTSMRNPKPGQTPMEVSSWIMQRYIPVLVHVDWQSQRAYSDDFNRVVIMCQRILTGQAAPQPDANQLGKQ